MAGSEAIEVTAELVYEDPERALAWLEAAFGFQTRLVVRDDAQRVVFAETGFGGTTVAVGAERPWLRSPKASGIATQGVRFRIPQDVDAHCARARAAGATILREPETFFFGDRSYDAADHEGHVWSFNGGDAVSNSGLISATTEGGVSGRNQGDRPCITGPRSSTCGAARSNFRLAASSRKVRRATSARSTAAVV